MTNLACPAFDDRPSRFPSNFWYVKNPKTSSSTLAGVFRSVAAHHAVIMLNPAKTHMSVKEVEDTKQKVISAVQSRHSEPPRLGLSNHVRFNSGIRDTLELNGPLLLFTSVREPIDRFYSFFIEQCQNSKFGKNVDCFGEAVDEKLQMATTMEPNSQLAVIRGNATDIKSAVAQYDFIFVRERFDESLVVFMILYGLDFADIVHLSSKVRTGKYPGAAKMPPALNDLIRTNSQEDVKLWVTANALLDEKIAGINEKCGGEAYMASTLAAFNRLQDTVANVCREHKKWYSDHGFSTVFTYWGDNGQAPRCCDFVVRREIHRWQNEGRNHAIQVGGTAGASSNSSGGDVSSAYKADAFAMPKKTLLRSEQH